MQNVTLPDESDVSTEAAYATARIPAFGVPLQAPVATLILQVAVLEAWVRALYAKHGEECPLFGPEEEE